MNTLNECLGRLIAETSSKKKLAILSEYKDNQHIKRFFDYCINPKYKFGVKDFPTWLDEVDCVGTSTDLDEMFKFMDTFLTDKKNVKQRLEQAQSKFCYLVLCFMSAMFRKDPNCGISKATYKKVFGSDLQEAKICKAETFSEKAMKNIKFPCIVQEKADGARCLCFVSKDEVTFISSNGKEYKGFTEEMKREMQDIASRCIYESELVFDGELLVDDGNGNVCDRQTGNGILNKALHDTITREEAERVRFIMWDAISLEEYKAGISRYSYYTRFNNLEVFVLGNKKYTNIIRKYTSIIFTEYVDDTNRIKELFKLMLSRGKEGVIVKNYDFLWQGNRIKDCVKFKLEMEATLEVVDWEYGTKGTKYENCLGALTCKSSDGIVTVSVGSGLTEVYRKEFMNRDKKTGFFIEVRTNGLIQAEDGTWSMFLPRMVEERFDKTEADSYETIKTLQEASMSLGS